MWSLIFFNTIPKNNPSWEDFSITLQYKSKSQFKVLTSVISGAGLKLFFQGSVPVNTIMCGYRGEVFSANTIFKTNSNYRALCGKSSYLIDVKKLLIN